MIMAQHDGGLRGHAIVLISLTLAGCSEMSSNNEDDEGSGGNLAGGSSAGAHHTGTGGTTSRGPSGGNGGMASNDPSAEPFPELHWLPTGNRTTWRTVSFIVPPGLTGEEKAEWFEMSAAGDANGKGECVIQILPAMAREGDLPAQAQTLLNAYFSAQGLLLRDPDYGTDFLSYRLSWVSAQGAEFVELTAELRTADDAPTDARGRIVLVGLKNEVIPIFAYTVNNRGCLWLKRDPFADLNNLTWQWLYYSLSFEGAIEVPVDLKQNLVGKWSNFSASGAQGALIGEIYAANNRYADARTLGTFKEISADEIGLLTTSFEGTGRYAVSGDRLARFPDQGSPDANLFRILERHDVSPLSEKQTIVQLAEMKATVLSDGTLSPYELVLDRETE